MNPTDLRVVSGSLKGRKIESPPSKLTHPMGSREKLALFNMITGKVEGAKVLDAYAGSGALGIEALSRGAKEVTFVEAYRPTAVVLVRNLRSMGLNSEIFTGTVARYVQHFIDNPTIIEQEPKTSSNTIDGNKEQKIDTKALNRDIKRQNITNAIVHSAINVVTLGTQGKPLVQLDEVEEQKNPSDMWTPDEEEEIGVPVVKQRELYDLIFADPPYSYFDLDEVSLLPQILKKDGTFVLSYPSSMKVPAISGLKMLSNHVYARAGIAIYRKV